MNNDLQTKLAAVCDEDSLVAFRAASTVVSREKRKLLRRRTQLLCLQKKCLSLETHYRLQLAEKEIAKYQDIQRICAADVQKIETELKDIEEQDIQNKKAHSLSLQKEVEAIQNLPSLKSPWPRLKFIGHACPGGAPGLGKRT